MQSSILHHLLIGQPTYWPSDQRKIPDLNDFCVIKGIGNNYLQAESSFELSSDHSPEFATRSTNVICKSKTPYLCSKKTDWKIFRPIINEELNFKTLVDLDAAEEYLNVIIQKAAEGNKNKDWYPQKICKKRKLRKRWQTTRFCDDTSKYYKAKEMKQLLNENKNYSLQNSLERLYLTECSHHP